MNIKIARTTDGQWHARGNTSCGKSDALNFDHYEIAELDSENGTWPGVTVEVCDICTELLIDRYKR